MSAIRFYRAGNLMLVDPPMDLQLREQLRYWDRTGGYGAAPAEMKLRYLYDTCEHDGRPVGVFPAPLLSRVVESLRRCGFSNYSISDIVSRPPPVEPDFSALPEFRPGQMEVLAKMLAEEYALCDCATGWGKSAALIVPLAQMFAHERVLVVVPQTRGKAIALTLKNYLEQAGLEVGFAMGNEFRLANVMITNPYGILHKLGDILDEVRVVLYDEVYTAAAATAMEALGKIRFARMYGFADRPFSRSDGRSLLIESIFGPVVASVTYQEAEAAGLVSPIRALSIPVTAGKLLPVRLQSEVTMKRRYYWTHDERNLAIARGVSRGAEYLKLPLDQCQTLITVDCLTHAVYLKRHLPKFRIVHGGNCTISKRKRLIRKCLPVGDVSSPGWSDLWESVDQELAATPKEMQALQKQFEAGTLKHVIATKVWVAGVNFTNLRMLVRADGGSSEMPNVQWSGRMSRLSEDKEFGLLIDFDDQFCEWAQRRAKSRFRIYRSRGFKVIPV